MFKNHTAWGKIKSGGAVVYFHIAFEV